jgi:caa(3)-type oxidase subunit IV
MKRVADVVWLSLLTATLAGWWLAEHQGAARWTVPLIMLIAAAKARAVVLHFMELKAAPLIWRLVFEAWVLLNAGMVVGLHWSARNMT